MACWKLPRPGNGRVGVNPKVCSEIGEKHRSLVPTNRGCGSRPRLATKFSYQKALILPIAQSLRPCQNSAMKSCRPFLFATLAALATPLVAQVEDAVTPPKPPVKEVASLTSEDEKDEPKGGIPKDLIDDEQHLREELAVNEFTAPSISKMFDTLQDLMPLPIAEVNRKMPDRMPLDRADVAMEIGFLIANGFLIVQAEQLDRVEGLAKDLTRYGKSIGAGERVQGHSAALLEAAKDKDVKKLKKELTATQRDVEAELVSLRDADLAHLISLGGWIRALEVASVAVDNQWGVERARKVMREDIADYYTESVGGLEPKISERANYRAMRDELSTLRTAMAIGEGVDPTQEQMKDIRKHAAKLVELALTRQQ